jgi:predicted metal-dependent peptidase
MSNSAKNNGPSLLAQTKAAMVYDHPFFASIILGIPFKEDTTIETAATNGLEIRFNPQWFNALTLPQAVFLLAHEVMHIVFQHCLDIGDKEPERWNTATDLVINGLLTKGAVGVMPSGGLLDNALVLQGGGTAEGVYRILPVKPKGQDGKPQTGSGGQKPLDSLHAPTQDAAELSKIKAETKIKVAQARDAAKQAGKLSSDLERLVKDLLKSDVDWRTVLHRFFSVRAKTSYSYAKPKRRSLSEDTYLPGLVGEKLGRVVIAIDCSGSVGDAELKLFSAEVLGLIEDCKPSSTEIIYFDSEILKTVVFEADDSVKIEPIGGGGTKFSPIFTHVNSGELEPACLVVITDLQCEDFGPEPSYPVLWASTHSRSKPVPFGEVTLIKAGKK